VRFPGPNDVVKLAERGYEAAERVISLVPRLVALVGEAEKTVVAAQSLIARIETTQAQADQVVARTEAVVARVGTVVDRTDELTATLTTLVRRFEPTLTAFQPTVTKFEPMLAQLEPMAARLVQTTSPDEVEAVVRLIDTLPELVGKMQSDIVPVLDTLGTVAPDLRDLLDLVIEVSEMLGAVPGLSRVKKKLEERPDQEREYTADEIPPSAPDRQSATSAVLEVE